MDISKFNKPIHITCPKCHTDFEFAGKDLVREKNRLKNEIGIIKAKMRTQNLNYGKNNKYYKKLTKQLEDKLNEYRVVKQNVQLACEQSEIQLFILFKKMCKERFGDEVVNKMLIECENEMSYRIYDLAKQNHTNFDGV